VALKSPALALALESVNDATTPLRALPSVAVRLAPSAFSDTAALLPPWSVTCRSMT